MNEFEVTDQMVEAGLNAAGTLLSCSITDQQRTDAYKAFLEAALKASGLAERITELEKSVKIAEDTFKWYGDLHAAKPDMEKAARNYELADEMSRTLNKR